MSVIESAKRPTHLPWSQVGPLGIYLNDHLAGSTGGVELCRRLARSHSDEMGNDLRRLAEEVAEDRATLVEIMRRIGVPVQLYKVAGGWLAEKFARVKMNGRVSVRSPLSTVLELEAMTLGVEGKAALWRTLRELADRDRRLDAGQLDHLLSRVQRQVASLERLRKQATAELFAAEQPGR
jgi:hypothetical protein